ncbi:lactoylglutathione lyase [Neoconidiobolus thromboides FSU 785]|nr:lactoylglutathione lyase [Neoconidiobolus thromboides FSU 785]
MSTTASNPTSGFCFNHTMIRVKDPKASVDFYTKVLGMKLLRESKMESGKFTLYFLGYLGEDEVLPTEESQLHTFVAKRSGVLELTHNWGTENDDSFEGYHNGNKEPRGFGHIAISVDDINEACKRFDELKVKYVKRLEDGSMKHIAFIADPDNYWVEIVPKTV